MKPSSTSWAKRNFSGSTLKSKKVENYFPREVCDRKGRKGTVPRTPVKTGWESDLSRNIAGVFDIGVQVDMCIMFLLWFCAM